MKLFGATLSPYVRKTAAFLNEKMLNWEHVVIGLGSDDPDFLSASPLKKIPALIDGDYKLSDSTAICIYLDAKYPDTRMIPDDAEARGRVMFWDEFADTVFTAAGGKIFFNRVVAPKLMKQKGDEAAAKLGETEMAPLLDYMESQIPDAGAFLVGDSITLADIALASPFANIGHAGSPVSDRHPRTKAWVESIHARDSFAGMIAAERKLLSGDYGAV
ncbi:MAG: glutathione S-transferase family protein [Pacificimonas sp.]